MPDLVIDFQSMTMNTTLANDLVSPPVFSELKNVDLAVVGRMKAIYGVDDLSTNVSPDVGGTAINCIAPIMFGDIGDTSQGFHVAIRDGDIYTLQLIENAWADSTTNTGGTAYPWNIGWGAQFSDGDSAVFLGSGAGAQPDGIYKVTASLAATKMNATSDDKWDSAGVAEGFLSKLFVANIVNNSVNHYDRLYWSVTGDETDFATAADAGFLDLRHTQLGGGSGPASGNPYLAYKVTGLRVYQNRLWIAAGNTLMHLTGTTGPTFGTKAIRPVNLVNGSTMYQTGGFLFYVDNDGIWQFNGSQALNVSRRDMQAKWDGLSVANDIQKATASWDDQQGIYMVYFPAVKEQWNYHYLTGQWSIRVYATTDVIRVIGPPATTWAGVRTNYTLGTVTNGKAYNANDQAITDDGNAITTSVTTGRINLGALNGKPMDSVVLTDIWVEYTEQAAGAITFAMDVELDGTATTQQTITMADAGASNDAFTTIQRMNLPTVSGDTTKTAAFGRIAEFKFSDADADALSDIRRIVIRFEPEEDSAAV